MTRIARLTVMLVAITAIPAIAQEITPEAKKSILAAIRLPTATLEARKLGVSESDIQTIFASAREQHLPSGVLTETLEESNQAIREHGPIDNFGAFVQEQLRSGKRGRELAAAIRAEHAQRGKGKGHAKADDASKMKGASHAAGEHGKPEMDEHGKSEASEHGKPEAAGNAASRGKPEGAGKSESTGNDQSRTKGKKGGS